MNFQDIRELARAMDVKTHRMKKTDVIRAIQREEDNIDCYGRDRAHNCLEEACLWRSDCLALNNNGKTDVHLGRK